MPELEKTRAARKAARELRRAKRQQEKHITGQPGGSARDRRKSRRAGKERALAAGEGDGR